MTGNQLAYYANKEIARANQAREYETQRHNLATEELERDRIRRIWEQNQINAMVAAETARHNKAIEAINRKYNDSVILLNEAKARTEGVMPDYYGELTKTQGSVRSLNEAKTVESYANTGLINERITTEQIQHWNLGISTVRNALGGLIDIGRMINPIPVAK